MFLVHDNLLKYLTQMVDRSTQFSFTYLDFNSYVTRGTHSYRLRKCIFFLKKTSNNSLEFTERLIVCTIFSFASN